MDVSWAFKKPVVLILRLYLPKLKTDPVVVYANE
jgi:hypothetical protein